MPSRTQLSPGTRLNGIYEIDQLIASGGMGEIYKGHTVQTGDPVAIKVLHPEFAENEAALGLFRREASALHNLHHEAIVRYYVFTIEPTLGRPYLAMEFVEGQSLTDLVRREPLTYEAVRSLVKRVAAGLHVAHERGIIHRDVSSDNIMIPGGDVARAKIIDFGIARSTKLAEGTIIGGGFAGKYNYVSPEQLGLFGADVQGKSDIYSLGLVLVEALTGQPIDMGGSQAAILDKRRKVPDLAIVDLRIRPLIEKMLQPDPADRPETMAHVATWPLPTSRPGENPFGEMTYSGGRSERGPQPTGGGRRWMAVAAIAALVAVGGAGTAYYLLAPDMPGVKEPPAPPLLGKKDPAKSGQIAAVPPPAPSGPSLTPSMPSPSMPAPSQPSAVAPPPAKQPGPPGPSLTPSGPPATPSAPPPVAKQADPPPPALTPGRPPATPSAPPPALAPAPPGPTLTPAQPSGPSLTPAQPAPAAKQGGTEIAALQPGVDRAEQIERYINLYDGGDCFFIAPKTVSARAAQIDGYGASANAFQVLDDAFRRLTGFEADIDLRQVTAAQCPAVTFLGRLRNERARAPRLNIPDGTLASGQALTGTIEGAGSNYVQLLLVSNDGEVDDLSGHLRQAGDTRTFSMRLQRTGAPGAQPQLLVAVTSQRPLETLRGAQSSPAAQVFPLALTEAARTGQAVGAALRYFKLDRN